MISSSRHATGHLIGTAALWLRAFALGGCLVLAGCASYKIHSDEALKKETGIKFYTAKPYLLVARTGNKEKPIEVSVISLPDLQRPLYAKASPGLGTSELSLTLSHGILTAFGQKSDTKIPETITSLGGLAESLATAQKTRRDATAQSLGRAAPDAAQAKVAQERLQNVLADLAGVKQALPRARTEQFSTDERKRLDDIIKDLAGAALDLGKPDVPAATAKVLSSLETWKLLEDPRKPGEDPLRDILSTARKQVQRTLAMLQPDVDPTPEFTLYEIDNSGGTTNLREVRF